MADPPPNLDADVRLMTHHDVAAASVVSALAGERFRSVAEPRIAACADDPPFTAAELEAYVAVGQAWVAVEDRDVVGYLIADVIDGCAHIEEVDVVPRAGGRGLGSRLLDEVATWAGSSGLDGVTLTTFRDVPWNAPWYGRRGFRALGEDELTRGLRELRSVEEAHGLASELRVVMRREVEPEPSSSVTLPGQATLLECWRVLARLSPDARVIHSPGMVAAVFPAWAPLNNAVVLDGTADAARRAASELATVYAQAGVPVWALWVPSVVAELAAPDEITAVGSLQRDTTTLVMRTDIASDVRPHDGVVETSIASLERVSADEPLAVGDLGRPDGQPGLSAWVMVQDGVAVATTWAFLHGTDCGIYAVETLPQYRRRGLARALVGHVLHRARQHGARTASLQSTEMGEPLYEILGFKSVGRYEEWQST